jgi:hypothetical protein
MTETLKKLIYKPGIAGIIFTRKKNIAQGHVMREEIHQLLLGANGWDGIFQGSELQIDGDVRCNDTPFFCVRFASQYDKRKKKITTTAHHDGMA